MNFYKNIETFEIKGYRKNLKNPMDGPQKKNEFILNELEIETNQPRLTPIKRNTRYASSVI